MRDGMVISGYAPRSDARLWLISALPPYCVGCAFEAAVMGRWLLPCY
jgi:hypothetical protein